MALLFEELTVQGVTLHNRVVLPPLATEKSTSEGLVTEELLSHYRSFAQTGIGLIVVEHAYVNKQGKASARQLSVDSEKTVAGLSQLAATIKSQGCVAVMQINHAGSAADNQVTDTEVVGPSAISHPRNTAVVPQELTVNEIAGIVEAFAAAAKRVQEAGFDGVEIHGAHGYLLNQFLSPVTNWRQDAYGGSRERRMLLAMEVTEAVRAAVGPDFLLLYRLGAADLLPEGLTLTDAKALAPRLQVIGVDIFDISGGIAGSRPAVYQGKEAYFAPFAAGIKQVVSQPVLVTGGITQAQVAEELLQQGKVDLIGVGRQLLKNPQWVGEAVTILR